MKIFCPSCQITYQPENPSCPFCGRASSYPYLNTLVHQIQTKSQFYNQIRNNSNETLRNFSSTIKDDIQSFRPEEAVKVFGGEHVGSSFANVINVSEVFTPCGLIAASCAGDDTCDKTCDGGNTCVNHTCHKESCHTTCKTNSCDDTCHAKRETCDVTCGGDKSCGTTCSGVQTCARTCNEGQTCPYTCSPSCPTTCDESCDGTTKVPKNVCLYTMANEMQHELEREVARRQQIASMRFKPIIRLKS